MCMDPAWNFNKKRKVDKQAFVTMAGQLLRETREGADIDRIFLADDETAEIGYINQHKMRKRVNIACDSNLAIIKDLIKAIE